MKKRQWLGIIFISLCIFAAANLPCFAAGDAKKNVKEANMLYQKGRLDEALQKYNDASAALPDSDIVNFNMGTALYKKEDYQKAINTFSKALISDDRKIEADALYNLGNCKYKLGKLKENTGLSTAAALLRESLDYYKRAVGIDQKNTDARFNHEFVERELKVLLDKLKQQQSNQDKQKEQQEQKQEQEKQGACSTGKEQGKEDKEKEESTQAQGQQRQEEEKKGQEGQSQPEEKRQKEEQATAQELQQEGENKELSEEGARALLERYGQDEATPDYMDKGARGYEREVLKDW